MTEPVAASAPPRRRVIAIHAEPVAGTGSRRRGRSFAQIGFFVLFAAAPVFDLFRFDLNAGHAWLLTFPWRLGIDDFLAGRVGATAAGLDILLRLFLPILLGAGAFIYAAWRWGRLYCGWLCPHFSAVETINGLMRRASGRHSIWDSQPTPAKRPDGSPLPQSAWWWIPTVLFAVGFAACFESALAVVARREKVDAGDAEIDALTKDEVMTVKSAPVSRPVEARPQTQPEVVEERTEFKLLVFRSKARVQVVVQPRRQDRFAAAAVYLPDHPQRSVPHELGEHGLHFDLGSEDKVRGVVAKVVVQLADGRNVTSEVKL